MSKYKHTLITFLGKGRDSKHTGYRTANYQFPDNSVRTTPYLGLELANYLKPDQLIILGTSGSMWGVLLENYAQDNEEEELRFEVMQAEEEDRVDQNLVDRIVAVLSRNSNQKISGQLISFARSNDEQIELLQSLAKHAQNTHKVSLDLTHGFRHLGMIGFLSAFMLEHIEKIKVDGLWYGALDMSTAVNVGTAEERFQTPVLKLDGLNSVQQWINALQRFDASGDYGVFADLLIKDGLPEDKANCLKKAAFYEATMNISGAAIQLKTLLPELDKPLTGASALFQKDLQKRLKWANYNSLSEQQFTLALNALNRNNYQRCATLGLEALITRHCEHNDQDPKEHDNRDQIRKELIDEARGYGRFHRSSESLRTLNQLRNSLAHGTLPGYKPLVNVIQNEKQLKEKLRSTIDRLRNSK